MSFAGILARTTPLLSGLPAAAATDSSGTVRDGGVSAIWVLANLSHTGMPAQGNSS
jgi:hypothetical protein